MHIDIQKARFIRQCACDRQEINRKSFNASGITNIRNYLEHINRIEPTLCELFKAENPSKDWTLENAWKWTQSIARQYRAEGMQREFLLWAELFSYLKTLYRLYDDHKSMAQILREVPDLTLPFNGRRSRRTPQDDGLHYIPL